MQKMQTEQSAVHSEHTYKPKEPPLSGKQSKLLEIIEHQFVDDKSMKAEKKAEEKLSPRTKTAGVIQIKPRVEKPLTLAQTSAKSILSPKRTKPKLQEKPEIGKIKSLERKF